MAENYEQRLERHNRCKIINRNIGDDYGRSNDLKSEEVEVYKKKLAIEKELAATRGELKQLFVIAKEVARDISQGRIAAGKIARAIKSPAIASAATALSIKLKINEVSNKISRLEASVRQAASTIQRMTAAARRFDESANRNRGDHSRFRCDDFPNTERY
jgi:methyl-accepting chemotaxis protein